jgi:uncharacterized protein (TIGR02678 family)
VTAARIALHLDPATELDEFQAAAKALISAGLVTDHYPGGGVLALVRRYEEPLRNEFARLCHWRLDVAPTCARLLRRPAELSVHRPARTATQSRRPFGPHAYASLCLVLAALEGLGEQTTITQLAGEVARLRAGDDALPFDLTSHAHRRAFVDAVAWLEHRGILTVLDGDTQSFLAASGDALYDVDRDASGRLLVSPPSVLAGLTAPEEFLDEPYPPTPEGAQSRARHRVHRRLLTEAVVYYDDLAPDEREYARQRRTRIREELERLTGCPVECRAEGQAVIGLPAAEPFPAGGAVAQAALLVASELAAAMPSGGDARRWRFVSADALAAAWNRVVAVYLGRFTAEYRAEPDRLLTDALAKLGRLGLVSVRGDGSVDVAAAAARYRADVRLAETLGV